MAGLDDLLLLARQNKASDVHITADSTPVIRIHGRLHQVSGAFDNGAQMIEELLRRYGYATLAPDEDVDFAAQSPEVGRQRVNVFHQNGRLAATIRLLNESIPTIDQLGLPPTLTQLAQQPAGLILITGPTGSGKSTTLASMVQYLNQTRALHVITIEDPVEYVYPPGQALIHQREVGRDTPNFATALRSSLREDPDVILVGEMRDFETVSAAVTAAETGHLVLSTLHTMGAAQTLDRIVDACPAGIQSQIRTQLSMVLRGVITQTLLPLRSGDGRCVATEVLVSTDAVSNLIRENKCHLLSQSMQSGANYGMHTLNSDLARLVQQGQISPEVAMSVSLNVKDLQQYLL